MHFSILLLSSIANAATRYNFTIPAGAMEVEIQHKGADYIKVHFERLVASFPGEGLYLTVSSADKMQSNETYNMTLSTTTHGEEDDAQSPFYAGDGTASSFHADDGTNSFYAMSVDSSKVTVRLYNSDHVPQEISSFVNIDHYLVDEADSELRRRRLKDQGIIDRRDVACFDQNSDEVKHSKAIARLAIFKSGQFDGHCTAWRVGKKGTFMLTNNHCNMRQQNKNSFEVQFNYKSPRCRNTTGKKRNYDGVVKLRVKSVVMCDDAFDFCLFTLNDDGNVAKFGSLGLKLGANPKGSTIYLAHHGHTHALQLTTENDGQLCKADNVIDTDAYRSNGFQITTFYGIAAPSVKTQRKVRLVSFVCDLQPGSSGAPVIDAQSDKVIALFNIFDEYGQIVKRRNHFGSVQIDQIWEKIRSLGVSSEGSLPGESTPAETGTTASVPNIANTNNPVVTETPLNTRTQDSNRSCPGWKSLCATHPSVAQACPQTCATAPQPQRPVATVAPRPQATAPQPQRPVTTVAPRPQGTKDSNRACTGWTKSSCIMPGVKDKCPIMCGARRLEFDAVYDETDRDDSPKFRVPVNRLPPWVSSPA